MPRLVLITRILHGTVSALFLGCIALIYVAAWRGEVNDLTIAALVALSIEGLLVVLNGGNCPLGPVFMKIGDDKPFFELLMPAKAAKLAVPVLGGLAILGIVLLVARTA